MKILIVDDEPGIVLLLKEWLAVLGHETFDLSNAVALPTSVVKQKYDVLILDIHLRGANGLWLISQVHAAAPDMAIIVVSGAVDPALERIALQEGARHYFPKPLDLQRLQQVLQELGGNSGSGR
jgi:DNA-binding NtrC family response regulator